MSTFIAVRIEDEQVERMDALVAEFGGNRSNFIRLAVEERLSRLERMLEADIDAHAGDRPESDETR